MPLLFYCGYKEKNIIKNIFRFSKKILKYFINILSKIFIFSIILVCISV